MLILKRNIKYRLWFDVDLRFVTINTEGGEFVYKLWFDVDLRFVTIGGK